jgi:hypothetical protein
LLCSNEKEAPVYSLNLLVTDFLEYPMMRGGGNRPLGPVFS